MAKYTHLRPSEERLFDFFLAADHLPGAGYVFDLQLGGGMQLEPSWPLWMREMAKSLSQRRVDVIAMTDDEDWLLEI